MRLSFAIRTKVNSFVSGNNVRILGNWEAGGGGFFVDANKQLIFEIYINGSYVQINSNTHLTADEWYTIVGTYDGSNMKIYVNGALAPIDSANSTATIATGISKTISKMI